jgi:tetratricopeptide (TPR) repeat protein
MRAIAALVAASLLGPSQASADEQPQGEALLLQDQGIARYEQGDFAGARALFERARALAPDKKNPYRWLGLADARLGQCAEAVKQLDRFLELAGSDDKRVPEVVRERYRCLALLDGRSGILVVNSRPSGATVRLDGANRPPAGTTPFRAELPVGEHEVDLTADGRTRTERATVKVAETTTLDLSLAPVAATATATVAARPAAPRVPLYRRWWLWTATIVVAAAIAVGLGVGLTVGSPSEPRFDLVTVMH